MKDFSVKLEANNSIKGVILSSIRAEHHKPNLTLRVIGVRERERQKDGRGVGEVSGEWRRPEKWESCSRWG